MKLARFIDELRRRRVVRAAVAYAAALFVVIQAADIVIPAVGLPDSVMTGLVVIGALGFPLALALAWALELTPTGVEREVPRIPRDTTASPSGGNVLRTGLLLALSAVVVAASVWWTLGRDGGDAANRTSIRALAVLPLGNLMGDSTQRHFVDGMHDILIGELARVEGLSVISQRSVLRFRDSDLSIDEIAAELDVDALIEGSVFRQGDSVRVTARLLRANPETDLWNRSYRGSLGEALTLQSKVARAVAEEIEITLTRSTREHMDREVEVHPEAMDAYLLARDHWHTRQQPRLLRAVELFARAVQIDSTFALGWAGLADGYTLAVGYGAMSRDSAVPLAQAAIDRAMALDPGLMEAHAARGAFRLFSLQDFEGALRDLSRVVELAPSYAQAHDWLGDALSATGRKEEAVASYQRAVRLDPLSPLMWRDLARSYMWNERCEEAIPAAERALEIDPEHFYALEPLARCQIELGRVEEGVETMLRTYDIWDFPQADEFKTALRAAWQEDSLEGVLRAEAHVFQGGPYVVVATRFAQVGEADKAFEYIDRALDAREALLGALVADPVFESLYDDPRWDEAIRRLDALGREPVG